MPVRSVDGPYPVKLIQTLPRVGYRLCETGANETGAPGANQSGTGQANTHGT